MQKQNPKYSLFTIHSCQARFWSIMFYLNMGETAKMAIEWGIDRNVIRNHWVLDVLGYPQFWDTYPSSFWNSGHAQHLTLRQQAVRKSPHRAVGEPRSQCCCAWLHFTGHQHFITAVTPSSFPRSRGSGGLGSLDAQLGACKTRGSAQSALEVLAEKIKQGRKALKVQAGDWNLHVSAAGFTMFYDVSHVSCFRDNLFRNIVVLCGVY